MPTMSEPNSRHVIDTAVDSLQTQPSSRGAQPNDFAGKAFMDGLSHPVARFDDAVLLVTADGMVVYTRHAAQLAFQSRTPLTIQRWIQACCYD